MAQFIQSHYKPCRVLDVGGGKGVLSFLLNQAGFESIVVDPNYQELPYKFRKDCFDKSKGRYLLSNLDRKSVSHINDIFRPEMVKDFDLIIGLHAHGCMFHTIDQCASLHKKFVLTPCCHVDEPVEKKYGINWNEQVKQHAIKTIGAKTTKLNFAGANLTIFI